MSTPNNDIQTNNANKIGNDVLITKIENLERSLNVVKTLLNTLVKRLVDEDAGFCLTCGNTDVYKCSYCHKDKLFCLLCNKDEFKYGLYFDEPRCIEHKIELKQLEQNN